MFSPKEGKSLKTVLETGEVSQRVENAGPGAARSLETQLQLAQALHLHPHLSAQPESMLVFTQTHTSICILTRHF